MSLTLLTNSHSRLSPWVFEKTSKLYQWDTQRLGDTDLWKNPKSTSCVRVPLRKPRFERFWENPGNTRCLLHLDNSKAWVVLWGTKRSYTRCFYLQKLEASVDPRITAELGALLRSLLQTCGVLCTPVDLGAHSHAFAYIRGPLPIPEDPHADRRPHGTSAEQHPAIRGPSLSKRITD